jgi:hypothetical protein
MRISAIERKIEFIYQLPQFSIEYSEPYQGKLGFYPAEIYYNNGNLSKLLHALRGINLKVLSILDFENIKKEINELNKKIERETVKENTDQLTKLKIEKEALLHEGIIYRRTDELRLPPDQIIVMDDKTLSIIKEKIFDLTASSANVMQEVRVSETSVSTIQNNSFLPNAVNNNLNTSISKLSITNEPGFSPPKTEKNNNIKPFDYKKIFGQSSKP